MGSLRAGSGNPTIRWEPWHYGYDAGPTPSAVLVQGDGKVVVDGRANPEPSRFPEINSALVGAEYLVMRFALSGQRQMPWPGSDSETMSIR